MGLRRRLYAEHVLEACLAIRLVMETGNDSVLTKGG